MSAAIPTNAEPTHAELPPLASSPESGVPREHMAPGGHVLLVLEGDQRTYVHRHHVRA